MSYDLYFTSPRITLEEFRSYFAERPNYELNNNQVLYENEDTGVYFGFDHNAEPPDDEDDVEHSVVFNLNFYRPHYFALEAEPEVSSFVRHFDCSIHDPQNEGMGDGSYSTEGFLKGWNHGNEFGYSAILGGENAPDSVFSRATDELEGIWRWNFLRNERNDSIGKDIFIPRIMFAMIDGALRSFCIWPDAISTLIPQVEFLWIPREEMAPRSFFGKAKEDTCVIPFGDALPVLESCHVDEFEFDAYELPSPNPPVSFKKFVRSLTPFAGEHSGVSIDSILNREWVVKYRKED